jgi:L-asparagine transporter-like permease
MASATLIVPIGMHIYGVSVLNIFGYVGTLAAFGFIIAYALIVMAAPAYLKRMGQLSPRAGAMSLIAIALLIVPAVGTVYPIPSTPMMYFPYIFLVYMIIGSMWLLLKNRKNPQIRESIEKHINEHHETTAVPATRIS